MQNDSVHFAGFTYQLPLMIITLQPRGQRSTHCSTVFSGFVDPPLLRSSEHQV